MQFILNKNIQNTKETLQVPSCADASARATVSVPKMTTEGVNALSER